MSFDRSKTPTWRTGYRYQYEPAQKGHVLLYPEGMIKLNDSAALIGGLIDGQRDVAQQRASTLGALGIAAIEHHLSARLCQPASQSQANAAY